MEKTRPLRFPVTLIYTRTKTYEEDFKTRSLSRESPESIQVDWTIS